MPQPTDLRTWWASASPRERDAKVAALLSGLSEEAALWDSELPPYSTSWEHAGELLERLLRDGWSPYLDGERDPEQWCCGVSRGVEVISGTTEPFPRSTAPEAIALAFCLAMEAKP